ncbi:carboxypeptidase-like regulatory domain-containing protein [uncultured Aquimarina sp.]|uniref:carboxypeptidase-like regulatory domain-containing protein n=1 Tax=uncultured Aquimarina sp. TaxID=575652 RepID=UPI00260501E2|nr:carboxypeptidase-like regulatory domain-containing protein [uncultured Aquimarina sp.]
MKKAIVFLLLVTYSAQAQIVKEYKNAPLQEVLTDISESYGLIFSYSNDIIQGKSVSIKIQDTPIDEILLTLQSLTKLSYNKISERQITVSMPDTKTTICGYLYDGETNSPLSYATIVINESNEGVISDENGFFIFEKINKTATISIQYVGYSEKAIPVTAFKKSDCQRIQLIKESTTLDEVLIIEYITKGLGKNIDGSLIITNEELGILPGQIEPDVFQSIQSIPGINSPDETATGIQIRGGSPDQNLILWDHIKMYNTGHLFGLISAFNPYVVSDAKIFKGGADPKYGDRVSGVIDITSDYKIPEKLEGGLGINGTHADLFLKAPIGKKIGVIVSGRRAYTDYLETPTYSAYFEKVFQNTKITKALNPIDAEEEDEIEEEVSDNNFFFYDTSVKLIADITEHNNLSVSGIYTKNDLAFEINNEEDRLRDNLTIQNEGLSFSWIHTSFKNIEANIKGYYSKYDSDYNFTETQETVIEEQSIRKNTVEDIGFDVDLQYKFNNKHSLALGYQFSNNEVSYTVTREGTFETPINETDLIKNSANTLYSNYKYTTDQKGSVNLGFRASHYSVVDQFYVEPRINIEYPITNSLRIKATGELRYQPISQLVEFEDTQLRLENNLWIHSDNDDIPVLESLQFSGGFLFSKNNWNFEIDGYYKNIDGLTSLTNGFNNINNDLSTGESDVVGVDVLLKRRFKNFRTWIGYTFNNIEYTFPEFQEASFPGNNDITHNFRISNTLEIKDWEFSLGWLWRSGAPFTDADLVDEEIEFGTPNALNLPNYHRLDASLTYHFDIIKNKDWKGQIGVSVLNLYNRQVPIAINYQLDENADGDAELDIIRQQSLGITPNVTFRMSF